ADGFTNGIDNSYANGCTNRSGTPEPEPEPQPNPTPEPHPHFAVTIPFKEIVDDLNLVTGRNYRNSTPATRRLIKARWAEGFRVDDFKRVHRVKFSEWHGNPEFQAYLRPETLYSPKFESYLNQPPAPPARSEAARHNLSLVKEFILPEGGHNGNRS